MKHRCSIVQVLSALFCLTASIVSAVPVAFPGAEGSGRFAAGGRGGDVYEVTNLSNSGPGSIVDAISSGNRTIVFRVSGTIELGDVILSPRSYTTIAGQTAPGDGICLKGRIRIGNVSNVVIRYLRVRVDEGGANSEGDAVDIAGGNHIIIDHVSGSYARDETISCQDGSDNVTVQWCILSEALTFEGHSYGSLIRGEYGESKSYHHNLYAHNNGRNPRPGNYTSTSSDPEGLHFDFRNNVMYNWGGSQPGYNADTSTTSRYNFIGNVCIAGPESNATGLAFKEDAVDAYAYWSGNAYGASYNSISVPANQWSLVRFNGFSEAEITAYKERSYEIPMEPVTTTSAAQALDDVLSGAGASFPIRDIIDTRIVNDVINGTGSSIETTDDQPEGGWPMLNSLPAPTDSDHDGMPDLWEIAKDLNENDPADRNDYDLSTDYTNLEVYLNGLVAEDDEAPTAPNGFGATAGNAVVELVWDDNTESDLLGYNVYRGESQGGIYVKLNAETVTAPAYTDATAENQVTYFYVITAMDSSYNESNISDEVFATPIDLAFYGDINSDKIINMIDLPGFWEVWLESDCLAASGWDLTGDCVVSLEEFSVFAGLWLGDYVAPAAPENVSAVGLDGQVLLDWADNSETDLTGYYVYRSKSSGDGYVRLNEIAFSSSEYMDEDVTNGTTYYYVVTAVDDSVNESEDSAEASVTPGAVTTSLTIQEDEIGFCGVDGNVESEHSGYTGTGYANTDNATGNGIDYRVNILSGGTYTFVFRYAGTSDRPADLIIDDVAVVSMIDFSSTGAWTSWETTVGVDVTLSAGVKDIRLEAASGDGLSNIDSMQINGVNLVAANCP